MDRSHDRGRGRLGLCLTLVGLAVACAGPSAVSALGGDPAPESLRGCWRVGSGAEVGKVEGYRTPHVIAQGAVYCFEAERYSVQTARGHRNVVGARWHRRHGTWHSLEQPRYWLALDMLMPGVDEEIHPDERCAHDPRQCRVTDDPFQAASLEVDVERGRLRLHHKHRDSLEWVPITRLSGAADRKAKDAARALPDLSEVQREEQKCFQELFARQDCVSWPDKPTCGGLATCRLNVRMHLPSDPPCALDPPSLHCERVMSLTNVLSPRSPQRDR